jgi:mutator protein MutT
MIETIIASGPVIIENGKVLLNKERKEYGVTPWLFPGGKANDGETDLEAICKREVKEEMGIEVLVIKQLPTIEKEQNNKKYVLHHFLAKRVGEINPAPDIVEWAWHDIDNLPSDCAPNVYEIVRGLHE